MSGHTFRLCLADRDLQVKFTFVAVKGLHRRLPEGVIKSSFCIRRMLNVATII